MGHVQSFPCAGNADIAKPTLFFHSRLIVSAACRREEIFFHAHHEHIRELKALGAMERHHCHCAAVLAHRIQIGNQRHVFKIIHESRMIGLILKFLYSTDKFADIFYAGTRLVAVFLGVLAFKARGVNHILHKFRQLHGLRHHRQAHHQLAELLYALFRAAVQRFWNIHAGRQKRHFLLCCVARQFVNRRIADGTLGHVDDAAHGNIIRRVNHHAQIRQNILNLFAVVEPEAAVDSVFDAGAHKRFFHHTGLRIGSVKHRKARSILALHFKASDLLADPRGFFAFILRAIQADLLARVLLGPQCLVLAVFVQGNHLIGSVQNIGAGTVILLELNDLGVREILFKIQNIADIRAAPAVDGLVVVADHTKISALLGQQAYKHILRVVGILILVYMNVAELSLIRFKYRRMVGKKLQRLDDQIVKVQRIGTFELFLVGIVHVIDHLAAVIPVALGKPVLRAKELVLRVRNLALHLARRQELFINVHFLDDFLERAHLIVIVINRKRARIAKLFDISAQNFCAAGMERGNPHVRRRFANQLFNTLAHLRRRFIGKGNGHNGPCRHALADQVRNAVGQRAGFAGACAGKHQKRPLKRFRREPLFSVEIVQIHYTSSYSLAPSCLASSASSLLSTL